MAAALGLSVSGTVLAVDSTAFGAKLSGASEVPVKGSATLTAAQMDDLMSGKWYVNLHTAAHPGGEVRGQLMSTP
jgi:hypothetical protein